MPKAESGIKRGNTFKNEKIIYPYDKDEIVKELEKSPVGTTVSFDVGGRYLTYTVEEKDGQKVMKDYWDSYIPIEQRLRSDLNNSETATIRYKDNRGITTEVKDFHSFKARPGADRVRITVKQESQVWDNDNSRNANKISEIERDIYVYKKIPTGFERTDIVYIDSKTNNKYRRFRGPAESDKKRMLNVYVRER